VIAVPAGVRVLIAIKPVDFRKGADTLAAVAKEVLNQDPFSGTVIVFRARRADRIKLIWWDGSGLVMLWKRPLWQLMRDELLSSTKLFADDQTRLSTHIVGATHADISLILPRVVRRRSHRKHYSGSAHCTKSRRRSAAKVPRRDASPVSRAANRS
jgi:hypothetical protein